MSLIAEIEWGPIDAAVPDEHFRDKFVQTPLFAPALGPRYPIVSGTKGSGKTAIQKWLVGNGGNSYKHKKVISFNDIQFGVVAKNLSQLTSISDISTLTIIDHYWQYVIVVEAMKTWADNKDYKLVGVDGTRVFAYLRNHGLIEMSAMEMLTTLVARAWNYVEKLTKPGDGNRYPSLPSNLTTQVIKELTNSPTFDHQFLAAKKSFYAALESDAEKALIVFDEFDDIIAKGGKAREQLQIIFDGLVQASYHLVTDRSFVSNVFLKVLVPHDRFVALQLRDLDKVRDFHWPIRWTPESIKEFLLARARLHPGAKGRSFSSMWGDLLPIKIKNEIYGVTEETFDYILRHTLYRPRHIQRQLDGLKRVAMVRELTDVGIRQSVREVCKELASDYTIEYQIDHPNLKGFLNKLKGSTNVMPFSEFVDIVSGALKDYKVELDVMEKVNQLFEIGFFGVMRYVTHHSEIDPSLSISYSPTRHQGKRYYFNYYYIEPVDNISSSLEAETLIAVHPIFFDFCDQHPHKEILVA